MTLHPDPVRSELILERLLMEAERMLPEHERTELCSLVSSGTPEELCDFIRGKLPVADLVAKVRGA